MTDNNKPKLELNWVGKNNPDYDIANIEPRILEEDPTLSNCANDPHTENMIIHGDNLLALKALLPEYEGKVKCIYIDPPYNTGNAFEHYDDNVEHSTWLSLMKPRLELLCQLLDDDGLLAIQIDDNEFARLYLLLAEVFKSEKNLKTIVVKMSEASGKKMAAAKRYGMIPKVKEFIILAKKNGVRALNVELIPKGKWDTEYNIFLENFEREDKDLIDDIISKPKLDQHDIIELDKIANKIHLRSLAEAIKENEITKENHEKWKYENSFRICQCAASESVQRLVEEKRKYSKQEVFFVLAVRAENAYLVRPTWDSNSKKPRVQLIFAEDNLNVHPGDFWSDIRTTGIDSEGNVKFKNSKKPELLIKRIIAMNSDKNDLILDSFLGSGTTAAVAHKMGRKYIGIEMGDHAYTHCKVRLDDVISGTDQSGISKAVDWKGGGAYKFYELAPSFIVTDEFGNPVIDTFYNDVKLIKALCKLLNFTYAPSKTEYWKHGIGQGKNFLYVTTQLLSCAMIQQIAAHLAVGETLIICPKKYEPGADKIDSRITVKKIPKSVLKACHFGKKEYLLPIKETAIEEFEEEIDDNE
jgi:adenine-specific DNA-methyltransferase